MLILWSSREVISWRENRLSGLACMVVLARCACTEMWRESRPSALAGCYPFACT
jgi:hypothetical protein